MTKKSNLSFVNMHRGEELPEKSVVITFDDGYENNCSIVLPMAEWLGFKFEVFTVICRR